MNSKIDLSVVIPVYNGQDFIESTLESVISLSSGFNVECIVVDDGSTDQTANIIRSFGDKILGFRQENAGESAAVNKGIELARGNYVLVVSADDPVFSSNLFEGVVAFFQDCPDVVAWYPDWRIIDDHDRVIKEIKLRDFNFHDLFSRNRVLPGPGTWIRTKAALAIGGRRVKWRYVGDYDFWLRLSQYGILEHRRGVLAQWRKHKNSTSISERGPQMALERIQVIEEFVAENLEYLNSKSISLARATASYNAAKLGFFSREINSRELFIRSIKLDFRVLASARIHEMIFMLSFPFSKVIVDSIKKWFVSYDSK